MFAFLQIILCVQRLVLEYSYVRQVKSDYRVKRYSYSYRKSGYFARGYILVYLAPVLKVPKLKNDQKNEVPK